MMRLFSYIEWRSLRILGEKNVKFVFDWWVISVAYRGGGLGVQTPLPPKFRRYRRSPRSHEQEEPVSRFPFVVHCVLIRL